MVPCSSVRTCRDAPSPSPRLDISANVLSPCHKRCRYRFRCIFFRWPGSRVHSAERSGAPSGAESKMNADSCAKEKEKKKIPTKNKMFDPEMRPPRPPLLGVRRSPRHHQSVCPPPLHHHHHFETACQAPEMASSSAVARGESVRCRQQEHHAAVPGEARRGPRVARLIYQPPPHNLKEKCIDPAFVQDHR